MPTAIAFAGHPLNFLNGECGVILSFTDDFTTHRIIQLIPPVPEVEADILAKRIREGESLESLGMAQQPQYGEHPNPGVQYYQMRR